jgi:group I intron endonuclease
MAEIYLITSPSTKKYIGQTVSILSNRRSYGYLERWKEHIREANNSNRLGSRLLNNAIRKYGHKEFKVVLLEKVDILIIDEREIYWIKELNTLTPNGYNLTTGGSERHRLSEESKKILSEKTKGVIKRKDCKLPIYLYECNEKNSRGYRITGHPFLKGKRFSSKKFTMDEKLQMALDYLAQKSE